MIIVLADDHGLKIVGDVTQEVYFPQRKVVGTNTFVIPVAAAMKKAL